MSVKIFLKVQEIRDHREEVSRIRDGLIQTLPLEESPVSTKIWAEDTNL